MKSLLSVLGILAVASLRLQADTISHNGTTLEMDFVDIGYAGNVANTTGFSSSAGAVSYGYRMGRFEVTADQWAAVRSADPRVGNSGVNNGEQPASFVSRNEALKFANWLTTGDVYRGAYQFNVTGALTNVLSRTEIRAMGSTVYVVPTENEWYKAAYFKSDGSGYTLYPTGNSQPEEGVVANYDGGAFSSAWSVGSGAEENNGTYDMGGNISELTESIQVSNIFNGTSTNYIVKGGNFLSSDWGLDSQNRVVIYDPDRETNDTGFRVVAIPEPSSFVLMLLTGYGGFFLRKRLRR